MWWQFLYKYLWHCADKRCYKASLNWRASKSWPLETEFRRQETLPLQRSFTARCFMNTTKSTLLPLSSELDFQVAKTDSDALFKLAELLFSTEEIILNRLLWWQPGMRQRGIKTHCPHSVTMAAKEVLESCFSVRLQTLPFVQHRKA